MNNDKEIKYEELEMTVNNPKNENIAINIPIKNESNNTKDENSTYRNDEIKNNNQSDTDDSPNENDKMLIVKSNKTPLADISESNKSESDGSNKKRKRISEKARFFEFQTKLKGELSSLFSLDLEVELNV